MRTIAAPLADLEAKRRQTGLEAPGLILIGEAIDHRAAVSWFEARPLFGTRVLVTRPRHQARPMIERLEELGAVAHLLPTMEIHEALDLAAVDAAIAQIRAGQWDWLAFTSANGVQHLLKRIEALGDDVRVLGPVKLAAIGPSTAAALAEYHL